jgi:hypothetical protein
MGKFLTISAPCLFSHRTFSRRRSDNGSHVATLRFAVVGNRVRSERTGSSLRTANRSASTSHDIGYRKNPLLSSPRERATNIGHLNFSLLSRVGLKAAERSCRDLAFALGGNLRPANLQLDKIFPNCSFDKPWSPPALCRQGRGYSNHCSVETGSAQDAGGA